MDSSDIQIIADNLERLLVSDSRLCEMLRYRVLAMDEAREIGEAVAIGRITVPEAASRMNELSNNQPYQIVSNKPATRSG